MPRLCSAERLSESMVDEIFRRGRHEYRNENGAGAVRRWAVGAYQAGVIKALAECGTQIAWSQGPVSGLLMVPLSQPLRPVRSRRTPGGSLEASGRESVLSVNRSVYFSLLKKLLPAITSASSPDVRAHCLRRFFTIFDNQRVRKPDGSAVVVRWTPTGLMDHYLDTDALSDGLPL